MKIAVIGGGASGLTAAITAVRLNNTVRLYERQPRVGKKLAVTGNGRCNLSNADQSLTHWHGEDPEFAGFALTHYGRDETLRFFRSLGLVTVDDRDGKTYPLSDQAGSVVDVLRLAAASLGVDVSVSNDVSAINRTADGFEVVASDREVFDKVIIACGSMASAKSGGTRSGYGLLHAFGHRVTKLYPALVQIKTDDTYVRSLKGIRADASVTVTQSGSLIAQTAGEVQFTDYGVSGPAVFEVSRAISRAGEGCTINLDLMRGTDSDALKTLLSDRRSLFVGLTCEELLTGVLQNRLGRTVVRCAGVALASPIAELSDGDLDRIVSAVKNFRLDALATTGFENAQIASGGVSCEDFDPETLESRLVPGLYACGEVLDVDGDCGGYNLQWAWSSGLLAGQTL